MALIQSVQARQHGSQDFEGYYSQLCALQDSCPLTSVKAHLSEGALDLNADRIRLPDWTPILNALRINKSLEFVGVRSYFQQNGQDLGKKFKTSRRPPPIRSKELSYRLCQALSGSLSVSHTLTFIELQGIPLRRKDVQILTKGILKNTSLEHLSLEGCRVGDHGVQVLSGGLKHIPTITSMNFSACGLTTIGAEHLAKLVKHQSTNRHSEAWKDSLRYRRPDLDRMAGIRRITLNANPLISDDGALAFAEALRDDLWLKALDLQQCGISNIGAKAFLDALHENSTIVVLDIRKNHLVDQDLLKAVMEQVMINGGGQQTQYKWLHTSPPKQRSKSKRSKTKSHSSGVISRKANKNSNHGGSKGTNRRSRSPGGALVKVVPESYEPSVTRPGPGFVPWRTAARASQRSMAVPMDQVVQVDSSPSGSTTPTRSGITSIHVHAVSSNSDQDTSHKDTSGATTMMSSMRDFDEDGEIIKRRIKDMQVENEELRRRLYIESRARAVSEARVVELEVDNSRLKHHVQLLEARSPGSPFKKPSVGDNGLSDLDDGVLDSIEESFQKFHGFLDLLREAGLGQLCNLVGLSPADLKSPTVASILQNHQPYGQTKPSIPTVTTVISTNNNGLTHGHYTGGLQYASQPAHGMQRHAVSLEQTQYPGFQSMPQPANGMQTHAVSLEHAQYPGFQSMPQPANAIQTHAMSLEQAHHASGFQSTSHPAHSVQTHAMSLENGHHVGGFQSTSHPGPVMQTQSHGMHSYVPTSTPMSYGVGMPAEKTMVSNGTTVSEANRAMNTVPETRHTIPDSSVQDRESNIVNSVNREPRVIHSKPLVSPPEQSGLVHTQSSNNSNVLPGMEGTILSEVQTAGVINTPANIQSSALYQASSTIGTQSHAPHASLLPPTSVNIHGHITQPPMSEGVTIPRTEPQRSQNIERSVGDDTSSDQHSNFPQPKIPDDDNMKDILLSKPMAISQGDSTSVTVGSVLTFTNPDRAQLNAGAGDAKYSTKSQDEDDKKDISRGSASEDDYEDDFLPTSDSGTNPTPRNASDRTSTPSKSSASHRTYTRSFESGSDDDVKSLGSSIHEDIGETPPHKQSKRKSSDESSSSSF